MEITLREVIEAIRVGGYPQSKDDFIDLEDGKVVAADAIGQAGLNLGVVPESLYDALNDMGYEASRKRAYNAAPRRTFIGDEISRLNDIGTLLEDIARTVESTYPDLLDVKMEVKEILSGDDLFPYVGARNDI